MARNKYPEETVKLIVNESLKLFIEKGYENTSIQDIINHLSGLSKGAIYHHFRSKEEIFDAACAKISAENCAYYETIRDDSTLNGFEKLKKMIQSAYSSPNSKAVSALTAHLTNEPKFLSALLVEIFDLFTPDYMLPVMEEGIRDGSIHTDYPEELVQVILVLFNIWINPGVHTVPPDQMRNKMNFYQHLLRKLGLDLIDEDIICQYVQFCTLYEQK